MLRLNINKITINYAAVNAIKNNTLHPNILILLKKYGRDIIQSAKNQMPYSESKLRETHSSYKKFGNIPHLRERYALQPERKTSFRLNGEKLLTWSVNVAPNKIPKGAKALTIYTYVMASGKINGKMIRYSNSSAKPFYIENAYKFRLKSLISESENILKRIITNDFEDNE